MKPLNDPDWQPWMHPLWPEGREARMEALKRIEAWHKRDEANRKRRMTAKRKAAAMAGYEAWKQWESAE